MAWEFVGTVDSQEYKPPPERPAEPASESTTGPRRLSIEPRPPREVPPEADYLYGRVRAAEGTARGDGFLFYGGQPFTPGKEFPQWEGRTGPTGLPTHAAGPGQWQPDTWNGLKPGFRERFGRDPDFSSQEDQRRMVWLNAEKVYGPNLAADIQAGKLDTSKLSGQWAGFKGRGEWSVTGAGKWSVDPKAIAYEQGRSNTSVVWMPPDDYLDMVPETTDQGKRRSLRRSLALGESVEAIPTLDVRKKGDKTVIYDQDGRTRALIAKEEGVGLIPVAVHGVAKGSTPEWVEDMRGQVRRLDYAPVPEAKQEPTAGERIGTGVRNIIGGATQLAARAMPSGVEKAINDLNNTLASHGLPFERVPEGGVDQMERERRRRIDAERAARGEKGIDWWETAGEVAALLPVAAATAPASLPGALAAGAAVGGVSGALSPATGDPNAFWREKAGQTALGVGLGAAGGAAGRAVAQVIAPQFRNAVGQLMGEGVRLTPGQMAGGAARRVEDALSSWPVVGQMMRSGQMRSVMDFNRAAWNRVLAPLGEELPSSVQPGREAAQYVNRAIDDAYGRIIPNLVGQADRPFLQKLQTIAQRAASDLPRDQRNRFAEIINQQLVQKVSAPARGDQLKGIDSSLGAMARGYASDPMHDNRVLGRLIGDLHAAFRETLERQNPRYAADLRAVNEAYANYVRVNRAAAASAAREGVFTPAQLRMAVRQSDPSIRKMDFGRGEALLQDLSDAAEAVLPRVVPDNGTPERLMTERALGMSGMGGAYVFEPGLFAAGVTASAPYTGAGMNALRAWATALPKVRNTLAEPIRRSTPVISAGLPLVTSRPQPSPQ